MARFDTDSVFTFSCNAQLWRFWHRVLPLAAYPCRNYNHNQLIDEAILFICNCMDSPFAFEGKKPRTLEFRRDAWIAMTGFEDILSAAFSFSEGLESTIIELRTRNVYMEAGNRARSDYSESQVSHGKGVRQADDPGSKGKRSATQADIETLPRPFMSSEPIDRIREAVDSYGCKHLLERETAVVKVNQKTMFKLLHLLECYNMKPIPAILTVMSLIQVYLPLTSGYTNSLTEDLISRKDACENLAERCLKIFAKLEAHSATATHYALLASERLSTLGHGLGMGETLLDKILGDMARRQDPATDYSQYTELEPNERIWGEHAL
ncbi:MAG: hypothetical protein GVY36_10095 [Verrucomicrobia bacterium]|jgi:hypothetical protein|nr:hypothetical protein [Verrucomicrobiota bacterium]